MQFYKPNQYRNAEQTKTVRTTEAFRLESNQSDAARKAVRNITYCFGIVLAITIGGLEPTNIELLGIDLGKEGAWPLPAILAALALYFAVTGGASWWHDLQQYRDEYKANKKQQDDAIEECIKQINNSLNFPDDEGISKEDSLSWDELALRHQALVDEGRDSSIENFKHDSKPNAHEIEVYQSSAERTKQRRKYEKQARDHFEEVLRVRKLAPGRSRFYWFWLAIHYWLPVSFLISTVVIAMCNYLE